MLDFNKARKGKASKSDNVKAIYDKDTDTITVVISDVSNSFVESQTTKGNQIINLDCNLLSRLKLKGNVIYIGGD